MTSALRVAACAMFIAAAAAPAFAQAPQITRGTIDKVDGATISLKPAAGPELTVKVADNAKIFGVKAGTIADVKPGEFIGVGAMPQPDGSQKAIQVTIFAESQRGTGEGFRPWDKPHSTMTNGTAGSSVSSVNGQVVTVTYKGGEQKIVIGPDAKIRMYVAGSKDELKPGAHIAVYNPKKEPDGSLQAARINVGIGGMAP
ncbi:MAG: hypothetical protein WB624_22810 [Xanthobacteraceae bacterium]|jgi:hypothetical protein